MIEHMKVDTWSVNTVGLGNAGYYASFHTVDISCNGLLAIAALSIVHIPDGYARVGIRRYTYLDSSGVNRTVELEDTVANGIITMPNSMRIDNATSVTFELGMHGGGYAQAICFLVSW